MKSSETARAYTPPLPRPSVAAPALWRPEWTAGTPRDERLLWLDKNENADPELLAIMRGVVESAAHEALSIYPECGPLYRKLGQFLGISPDHLLLTAGSDGAIRSVFEAFISPGDPVVHTVPTFAMYSVYAQMYGARAIGLEYRPGANGPELSASEIEEAVGRARPKLVCLPNPDSPTGTLFQVEDLRRIIEAAGEAGALILIDEAYHPFTEMTALPWIDEYPHLVIARTFAKAWGLAGLRIGYAASCPEVAKVLHKVRPMYEVNSLAVAAMERALDYSAEVERSVGRLNDGKAGFLSAMSSLGYRVLRSHGNFLHVAFGADAPRVHERLKSVVLYRPDFKEPCLKGFSRFSATTRERFQPVINAIQEARQ